VAERLCHVVVDGQTTRLPDVHSGRGEHDAEPHQPQSFKASECRARLTGTDDVVQGVWWNVLILLDDEELLQLTDRQVLPLNGVLVEQVLQLRPNEVQFRSSKVQGSKINLLIH